MRFRQAGKKERNRRMRLIVPSVFALAFGLGFIQAANAQYLNPPGNTYGLFNCGCYSNRNATPDSCNACCDRALHNGDLDSANHTLCGRFCDNMNANCDLPGLNPLQKGLCWLFGC